VSEDFVTVADFERAAEEKLDAGVAGYFFGGAEILERVREVGEPWTCGFEPREMPAYLVARSFALLEDLSADEYRSRYFGGAAGSMKGYSFYRAVLARRSGPERSNLTARRGTLT